MLDRLPVQIDPMRLAAKGDCLQGQLQIASMQRLSSLLHDASGNVAVELQFDVDESQRSILKLHLQTTLGMICMRCGQPMTLAIDSRSILGLVASEKDADELPEGYEPLVITPEPMTLSDIVEDELLLALPIVAMHEDNQCHTEWLQEDEAVSSSDTTKENPFAVLADLKSKLKE
jgi:uncharacterized protein